MAATARNVDLSNVKEGGNFRPKQKPEGDYLAKIVKADDHTPKKAGSVPGWVLTIQIEGDARSTYPYYLSPAENQAWKIGPICRAAGLNVKSARIKFDPNRLVGKILGVALIDDEYEGRAKSSIDDVFPKDEVGGNADEAPEDDETYDDTDEVADDEVEDTSEYEDDEPEEEEPAPAPKKRVSTRKPAPAPEPEDADEDLEDDEEEPPAPPVKRTRKPAATTAPVKRTRPKPAPVEEDDDLDDLDTDDLDG